MRTFSASIDGLNRLELRERLRRYANEQWVADHKVPEPAAESMQGLR
jgi:hypothetical protein